MSLPDPSEVDDWTDQVAEDAEAEMNAEIQIYDPSSADVIEYIPLADTGGGTTPDVLCTTKARIVRVRRPQFAATTDELTSVHPVRFQIPRDAQIGLIAKGMRVKVTRGGRDSAFEELVYVVTVAINGSHQAVRTIETITELVHAFDTNTAIPQGLFPSEDLFPEGDE